MRAALRSSSPHWTRGDRSRGFGSATASLAACAGVSAAALFPYQCRAAASAPNTPSPHSQTLRYSSRMRSFDSLSSSAYAIHSSRSLRTMLLSGVRYRFLASCCVIVLPPRAKSPCSQLRAAAFSTASQSTPSCAKNFESSE